MLALCMRNWDCVQCEGVYLRGSGNTDKHKLARHEEQTYKACPRCAGGVTSDACFLHMKIRLCAGCIWASEVSKAVAARPKHKTHPACITTKTGGVPGDHRILPERVCSVGQRPSIQCGSQCLIQHGKRMKSTICFSFFGKQVASGGSRANTRGVFPSEAAGRHEQAQS
jgi:hypothetical protein